MASLFETWREKAYGNSMSKEENDKLWKEYFALETEFYKEVLSDPAHVYSGTFRELREHFQIDSFYFTGILDGINESLKGYENPLEGMDEDTELKIEIDPEKLYYNMVAAKADWLYGLPQWDAILTEEKRRELFREQKRSGTVRRNAPKIYPNDPCPCGSGKKYKKCCMGKKEAAGGAA